MALDSFFYNYFQNNPHEKEKQAEENLITIWFEVLKYLTFYAVFFKYYLSNFYQLRTFNILQHIK